MLDLDSKNVKNTNSTILITKRNVNRIEENFFSKSNINNNHLSKFIQLFEDILPVSLSSNSIKISDSVLPPENNEKM